MAPVPAGALGLRSGPAFAATDSLRVTLTGAGGHGSRPEATVDPVVMAAATVMRLQTIVSREVAGTDTAVVTVGGFASRNEGQHHPRAGRAPAQRADLRSARAHRGAQRHHSHRGGEADAAGAPVRPEIVSMESAPAVINDPSAVERTRAALESVVGAGRVVDPGQVTGSEDVGALAEAAGAPCVYWLLGGADPAAFAGATDMEGIRRAMASLPSNHSPNYAPVIQPTLTIGSNALAG